MIIEFDKADSIANTILKNGFYREASQNKLYWLNNVQAYDQTFAKTFNEDEPSQLI
jgi:uncharacterized protein Smg (DUF494 family)